MKIYAARFNNDLDFLKSIEDEEVWVKIWIPMPDVPDGEWTEYIRVLHIDERSGEVAYNAVESHIVDKLGGAKYFYHNGADHTYYSNIYKLHVVYPLDTLTTDEIADIIDTNT